MTDVHQMHSFLSQKNISVGKATKKPHPVGCLFMYIFVIYEITTKFIFQNNISPKETRIEDMRKDTANCFRKPPILPAVVSIRCRRRHKQSPRLRCRWGVRSPGAVLQLSLQEQPQSAPWCQPLLLHLPTGQLLRGARWLQPWLSQTTRPHRQLLRSGGWWVTLPYSWKIRWSGFSCTFFFFYISRSLHRLFINTWLSWMWPPNAGGCKSLWKPSMQIRNNWTLGGD